MSDSSLVIKAYLETIPEAHSSEAEQTLILELAELSYKPAFSLQRRSIDLEIFSNGTVSAKSIKLYNIIRFPQWQFQSSLLKLSAGAAAISTLQPVATVLGLLALLHEFIDQASKTYTELDARVLLCIYRLGRLCHLSTIPAAYEQYFGEPLTQEELDQALRLLSDYRSIRLRDGQEVELIETIHITRQ